jgi:integrase
LAGQADLPDLVRFLLGTGCRIGEALALTWPNVDLERHLINIDSTLIRVKGQGLLIKRPKTKSSISVLRVPLWLVEILRDRRARDPESQGDHRRVRRGTSFGWVVPPTYRKTVATMLDRQGLSARTIADQLGHARISMTQDVYMGRRAVDQAPAAVLEGISPPGHDDDDQPPAVLSVVV